MTEEQLSEANGLVARFYVGKVKHWPHEALFDIQRRLMVLGVTLNNPVEAPDPHAPPGGSALVLKAA